MWGRKSNGGPREGTSSEWEKSSVFRTAHHSNATPRQRCSNIRIWRKKICTSCTGLQMATLEKRQDFTGCVFRTDGLAAEGPSLDLLICPVCFFPGGQLKSAVFETPRASPEDLVAQISAAAANVRDMPGIFQRVRDSIHCRCEACLEAGSLSFVINKGSLSSFYCCS